MKTFRKVLLNKRKMKRRRKITLKIGNQKKGGAGADELIFENFFSLIFILMNNQKVEKSKTIEKTLKKGRTKIKRKRRS